MTPDEIKELKELIEFLKENDIGEFDLERDDLKVRIKFGHPSQATAASALDIARLGQLLSPGQHAPAAPSQGIHAVAVRFAGLRHRCRRRGGEAAYRKVAHRGHFLRVFFSRRRCLRQDWGRDRERAGAVHRRGHETDERDRIRRSGRSGQASGHQWPAGRIWPAALRPAAPLSMLTVSH